MNYFELFGMPVTLKPDAVAVKKKFYELSRKYHPDFYTQENEFEQSDALEMSSMVNKAFKALQDKDETIKYVLQQKGLLEEEEKYQLPNTFLMEMMELNEQMMDAKMDEDEKSKTTLKQQVASVEEGIYTPVKEIIEGYDDGVTTMEELLKVKEYYYKKKYLKRILAKMQS